MAVGDIIVGIDIGTSKASVVVGEINEFKQVEVIATSECKCFGMKKCQITDEEEISRAISKIISEVEERASLKINSAYVTIPGKYVMIVQNSIVKEAKDKYIGITTKDVNSALYQVKDIDIPDDKILIDVLTNEFSLDNGRIVDDPVGSLSSTFTVKGQVILADKEYVKKLTGIFKKANLEIDGIVPNVLAERQLILDKNELKDSVMILDVGAGNTDIGVFNGENFMYTDTIQLGGDNITNDISYVFNITIEEADRLKRQYGLALKSFIDNDTDIMLSTYQGDERVKVIKSSDLVSVIEARIEEIFSLVNKNITNEGIKQNINNVILTGKGMTSINKSDVVGKITLNIPVKISTGRLVSTISANYRSAYALIEYVASKPFSRTASNNIVARTNDSILKGVLEKIKEFFYS